MISRELFTADILQICQGEKENSWAVGLCKEACKGYKLAIIIIIIINVQHPDTFPVTHTHTHIKFMGLHREREEDTLL